MSSFDPKPIFLSQSDAETAATYLDPNLRSHSCRDQLVFQLVQGARLPARIVGYLVSRIRGFYPFGPLCSSAARAPRSNLLHQSIASLLRAGPYQFTRNPMYLGLVLLTLGIAIWAGAWPMFGAPVALFATANWVHIPFEEAKMRRQFGAVYDNYVTRVRRWI